MNASAGAAAALTLAVLAGRWWWPFDLLTHFRLQYVVASLLLLSVALLAGARPAAVLFALVAIVHGWAVRDLWLPPPAPPPTAAAMPITVLSANVLRDNPRPEAVAALIRDSRPDVVVLVEAQGEQWTEPLDRLSDVYAHAAPDGWRNAGEPVVILSRHPIRFESVAPKIADRPPFLLTTIVIADRQVTVAGVHPTSPDAFDGDESRSRNRQLDLLAERLAGVEGPAIVAGDFNTSLWSPHARDLLRQTGLRSAAQGHGWHATWPYRPAFMRIPIDHVLVRGPIVATDFRRGPYIGSDHLPVIADLRLVRDAS